MYGIYFAPHCHNPSAIAFFPYLSIASLHLYQTFHSSVSFCRKVFHFNLLHSTLKSRFVTV